MKKYSKPQHEVATHKVDIIQKNKSFLVFIDGLPLNRKGSMEQATFTSAADAYQAAEVALAGAPKTGTLWNA